MKISYAGIDNYPESWELDFNKKTFNFTPNYKKQQIYRYFSFFIESLEAASISFFFMGILLLILYPEGLKSIYTFIIPFISILLYVFSSNFRFKFRKILANFSVKEITEIKVSNIQNKRLKIYFKNYYLDCIRYGDFVDGLTNVKCYPILNGSPIWVAEFLFKKNLKTGFMLLKYY